MSSKQLDEPVTGAAAADGDAALPCRGCTRKCSEYGRCDGAPWRSAAQSLISSPQRERKA